MKSCSENLHQDLSTEHSHSLFETEQHGLKLLHEFLSVFLGTLQ
jgi:hypothetical protein